jgi:hypothetical protein
MLLTHELLQSVKKLMQELGENLKKKREEAKVFFYVFHKACHENKTPPLMRVGGIIVCYNIMCSPITL